MERSLTRGFSVPSMAARAGDFAGFAPICDPLTIPTTGTCTPFANNRIPEERIDPVAAGLLAHVPPPTSNAESSDPDRGRGAGPPSGSDQPALRSSAERLRQPAGPLQHVRRGRDPTVRDQRASGSPRARIWPLADHEDPQRRVEPHAHFRNRDAERSALRVDDGRGRTAQPEPRKPVRPGGRAAWRDDRPSRHGLSTDINQRPVQHVRRSDDLHDARQPALRTLRQLHDRPGRASREVRRVLLPPEAPAGAAGKRTWRVHLHGTVQRQRICRLPSRVSRVSGVGHRPRRRERPHQLAASLRAGRLAAARQPVAQLRPPLRVQPAHVRRRQPAVDDRSVDPGRPVRHRQRRHGRNRSERRIAPAADSDSVRDERRGRLGPRPDAAEQGAAGAATRLRPLARRRPRRRSRRLRNLPESVGVQRPDGVRAQPAVLLHQTGRRPADRSRADAARPPTSWRAMRPERSAQASWTTTTPSSTARPGAEVCSTSCGRRPWPRSRTWEPGRSARTTPPFAMCRSPGRDRFRLAGRFHN